MPSKGMRKIIAACILLWCVPVHAEDDEADYRARLLDAQLQMQQMDTIARENARAYQLESADRQRALDNALNRPILPMPYAEQPLWPVQGRSN